MSPSAEAHAICFGKLPIAGDFVRGHLSAPELATLDQWIQEGIHRSQTQLGSQWQPRFDALPPARFLWSPQPHGPVFAGWWQASRDAAGRRYPFLIAVRLCSIGAADHMLLPVALTGFFTEARRLLDGTWRGLDVPGVIATVQGLAAHVDLPRARAEHDAASATAPMATTWAGCTDAPELLFQDFEQLVGSTVAPRFGLRWTTRGEAIDVSFWLAVLAHYGAPQPRLLMWHSATDRTPGVARAAVGNLEPRMFTGIVFFDHDDDDAYDLGRAYGDGKRVPEAQRRFAAVLSRGSQGQVLTALRQEVR